MIIQLPNGERRELNNLLSIEEKCVVVENILNEFEDYLEIDTLQMKEQQPIYKVLSKDSMKYILGNNDFNA